MTPEERAKKVWAGNASIASITEAIREAVEEEREKLTKIAEVRAVEASQPGSRLEAENIVRLFTHMRIIK